MGLAFTISAVSPLVELLVNHLIRTLTLFFFLLKYIFKENFKSLLYPSVKQSHLQEFIWKTHLQRYENAQAQGHSPQHYW